MIKVHIINYISKQPAKIPLFRGEDPACKFPVSGD